MVWRILAAFRQNCLEVYNTFSGKNVAQGTQFLECKVYADIRGGSLERGRQNESVVVENGDFRFFCSLSSEHFTYMATRQLSRDATVDDLGDISRSLDCFTSNFSRTVRDTAKVITDY